MLRKTRAGFYGEHRLLVLFQMLLVSHKELCQWTTCSMWHFRKEKMKNKSRTSNISGVVVSRAEIAEYLTWVLYLKSPLVSDIACLRQWVHFLARRWLQAIAGSLCECAAHSQVVTRESCWMVDLYLSWKDHLKISSSLVRGVFQQEGPLLHFCFPTTWKCQQL